MTECVGVNQVLYKAIFLNRVRPELTELLVRKIAKEEIQKDKARFVQIYEPTGDPLIDEIYRDHPGLVPITYLPESL